MSEAEQAYLSRMLVEMLPLQWLGASEAEMIALISALTVSDAYIAPEYVEESAYVLFLYEGEFALLAAFNHLDTGVITSTLRLMPLDALYALLPL